MSIVIVKANNYFVLAMWSISHTVSTSLLNNSNLLKPNILLKLAKQLFWSFHLREHVYYNYPSAFTFI